MIGKIPNNMLLKKVSEKWGNGQTITGPFLSIPYDRYIKRQLPKDTTVTYTKTTEWLHILPENLEINGSISPEKRYRGIYEVVVYESDLKISGNFISSNINTYDIPHEHIHFDKTSLNIGITDLKGIEKQITLNWNKTTIPFNSSTSTKDIVVKGINAPVNYKLDSTDFNFSLDLQLKGSQNIYFIPVGKTTDVNLKSDWPTPSFAGTFLPDSRTIDNNGFTANWNILHLNRDFPQSWIGKNRKVKESIFGANLLLPVDNYKKSHRVARYSILFLVLTFLVFFFVEVLNKVFIHPIQYLLVGIALIIFYSLLLSFSEHFKFNIAYILSSVLTLSLITGYTSAILKSKNIGLLLLGILSILYTFIFTIMQLEDYALLIGSLGIFIILGIVMYYSRKIDWYELNLTHKKD